MTHWHKAECALTKSLYTRETNLNVHAIVMSCAQCMDVKEIRENVSLCPRRKASFAEGSLLSHIFIFFRAYLLILALAPA